MTKRKLLIFIFSIISILSISAETLTFKTTGFSYRERNYYSWSDWKSESSNIIIVMMDNILIIYSPTVQTYDMYNLQDPYQDVDGDWVLKSNFIDQDGDVGEFNLIYRWKDEIWQIYIRFNNIQWVYDVIQIK
nr:MAG TPA: hypothetical protein [Bacteriophage sp.]